jgi:methionyl aminopeptidase
VHGIPSRDEILEDGDIIGIDFGIFKNGYCGDSARTIPVGEIESLSEQKKKLIRVTKKSLDLAIEQCWPGKRLGDIGWAVQNYVESQGFSVVKDFVGHGIGKQMHEDPPVNNWGRLNSGKRLKTGLVIAVEPMVNAGSHEVEVLEDQWTAVIKDRSFSAHFEHSIAITEEGPWVLSSKTSSPGIYE